MPNIQVQKVIYKSDIFTFTFKNSNVYLMSWFFHLSFGYLILAKLFCNLLLVLLVVVALLITGYNLKFPNFMKCGIA